MRKYKTEDGCHLVVDALHGNSILAWYIPEEEDVGGIFGETDEFDEPCEKEGYKACYSFVESIGTDRAWMSKNGFAFMRESDAKRALTLTNAAMIAAQDNTPWPEWAVTAVANGWKPPKGWKP